MVRLDYSVSMRKVRGMTEWDCWMELYGKYYTWSGQIKRIDMPVVVVDEDKTGGMGR